MEDKYVELQKQCRHEIHHNLEIILNQVFRLEELSDALRYVGNDQLATRIDNIGDKIHASLDGIKKNYEQETINYMKLEQQTTNEIINIMKHA